MRDFRVHIATDILGNESSMRLTACLASFFEGSYNSWSSTKLDGIAHVGF